MSEIVHSNPVDVITFKIFGIFDAFNSNASLNSQKHAVQIVLLLVSLYKDGIIDENSFSNDIDVAKLKKLILESQLNNKTIEAYLLIIDLLGDSLANVFKQPINYLSFLLFQIEKEKLVENFSKIFDDLIYKLYDSFGRFSGQSLLPKEITRLMFNLANIKANATIYNPFAGVASFGVLSESNNQYIGQEISINTQINGQLRLLATNSNSSKSLLVGDSIFNWNPTNEKFDLIISSPPFNMPLPDKIPGKWGALSKVESFVIEKGLEDLKKDGKLIILVPESFLSSGGQIANLRDYLIDQDLIESIVPLPIGVLTNANIKTSIVVLNKQKVDKGFINFINTEDFIEKKLKTKKLDDLRLVEAIKSNSNGNIVKNVSVEEVYLNDRILESQRYFIDDNFTGVRLKNISNFIKGSRIDGDDTGKIVKIKNLTDNIVNFTLNENEVEKSELPRFGIRKIQQSCLLVALRWRTLKPTYFEYKGEPIYIPNDILAIKVDKKIVNISYLINELHSDYVINQLSGLRRTGIIPTLRSEDFFKVKVKLPSIEEQNKKYFSFADKFIQSKVHESEVDYNKSKINIEDENSFLRHQIAGSLKNVRGAFKFVQKIIDEQIKMQVPNLDNLKADERLETTFNDYMNIIARDLVTINKAVNKAGDKIDLLDLNIESFDLLEFIKDYANILKVRANNLFTVELDLDENAIIEYGIKAINIEGDKDIIRKMFDNIIENAEKHAFTNSINNNNKIKFELIYDFEDFNVQLDICNTGNPLPENMTHESMIRKGSSSGKNSGDGIGMWFVNEVMKIHKGHFGYTDEENGSEGFGGEYVTSIELTFPIIPAI